MTRIIKRSDVYYAKLPKEIGAVQTGVRPVVVIQNDKGNEYSPTVIVACITHVLKNTWLAEHVVFLQDILPKKSMVLAEQILTIDKQCLINFRGQLKMSTMKRVDRALKQSLGLK